MTNERYKYPHVDLTGRLIKLAAKMVTGEDMPSEFSDDHPPRRMRGYWLNQLERVANLNKRRAIELREIVDELSTRTRIRICTGCRNEIDPETCYCGDPIKGHTAFGGHSAVPIGCDCARAPVSDEGSPHGS